MLLDRVIDNLGLEVEPFATCGVASGWRLPVAAQDLVSLHFTLEGEGRLVWGDGHALELPPQSLAVVPPGMPHRLEAGTGVLQDGPVSRASVAGLAHVSAGPRPQQALLVACGRIRAVWAGRRGLFDNLTEPLVVSFADAPRMKEVFATLLAEQASDAPGRTAMMTALMQQCLVELFRRLCGRDECKLPWLTALEDPRLARALRAIHDAPERPHTLDRLAEAAGMSRSAFAARFRTLFGQTAMDYVRDVRLREAARLLKQPDMSVEGAAAQAGFASRSHFTRAFRTMFGKAPGEYRRRGA